MKNLKKVLALALAFVMCFTMFAGAAVYTDVPAGSDYSEAVSLLSDLGVIAGKPDGSYGVNDTITRADAACLIARLMTGETTPSKYAGASNFTDVAKDAYYESSVAYCAIMGITSGTGNGKYEPLRTITDGEFVAMVTRALGYDTAENPLQFPMGNIAVAQAEGLLDGVNCVAASPALRGEDAQIIYNALFADFDRAAKNQNIYQGADDHANFTIAEEVFNLARLAVAKGDDNDEADFYDKDERDDITCAAHTWVVAGKDTRDGENEYTAYSILDKNDALNTKSPITFSYDGDAESILGYQVELWGDVDHTGDDFEVVAVKTIKGQTGVEWNPSMDYDGSKVVVDDEKYQTKNAYMPVRVTETKDKIEGVFTTTKKNSDAFNLVSKPISTMTVLDGNQYRLCDWDSDGEADFIIQNIAKYAEVSSLTNKRIGLKSDDGTDGFNLDLDLDNLIVEVDDAVEKGDVVEIKVIDRSWTKSDDEIVTISITPVDTEVKELTKLSTKKAGAYYDDEAIQSAVKTAWNWIELDEENLGSDYTLSFNRNGLIVKSEEGDGDNAGYLMILDTGKGSSATNNRKLATVDVMLGSGEYVEDMPVVKDVDVDVDGAYDEDSRSFNEIKVVGQVFKYYTNSDGEITKLKAQTEDVNTGYTYDEDWDRLKIDGTNYGLKGADVIFVLAEDAITDDNDDHDAEVVSTTANWHIDDDDVAVLTDEDLDDLDEMGVAEFVDIPLTGLYGNNSWLTKDVANDKISSNNYEYKIAYKANDNKDIKVAVLGVEDIEAYKDNVKVALVTSATIDSKGVVSIEAAMDGKVDTFESDDDEDLRDVVVYLDNGTEKKFGTSSYSDSGIRDLITAFIDVEAEEDEGGKYAEVVFNKAGNIKTVRFMEEKDNGKIVKGLKYQVSREVIGNTVEDDRFSVMSVDAVWANEDEIYFIASKSDDEGYEVTDDTLFYSIDDKPTIDGADDEDYAGKTLKINNWFDGELDITAEKSIQATINDANDFDGDYYVADVAIKIADATDSKPEAVAVFGFADVVYEKEGQYEGKLTASIEDGAVAFTAGKIVTVETDKLTPGSGEIVIKDSKGNTVHGDGAETTMFNWVSGSDETKDGVWTGKYETTANVVAGTYTVVYTKDGKKLTDTFVVGKASAKVESARYSKRAVVVVFDSEDAAEEYASHPELFTMNYNGKKVEGKQVRQGTVQEECVVIEIDESDITSTTPISVVVADSANYDVNNGSINAEYDKDTAY